MGDFRIEIKAAGPHGCQRDKTDGQEVYGCKHMLCPDCQARELVEVLKRMGCHVYTAQLTHWPGQPVEVVDDLLSRVRTGSFPT